MSQEETKQHTTTSTAQNKSSSSISSQKSSNKEKDPKEGPIIDKSAANTPDWKAHYVATKADFENYKRRTQKEWQQLIVRSNAALLLDIVAWVDDFERAQVAWPKELPESCKASQEGFSLTYKNLQALLKKAGVEAMPAEAGTPFDAHQHEALSSVAIRGKEDLIVEVVSKGYLLHGELLRPAKVITGQPLLPAKEKK